jgi:hypothetical protein
LPATFKSLACAAAAILAASLVAAPALANVIISATGEWSSNAPSTPYSVAPGDTFAFAISVPSTFTSICPESVCGDAITVTDQATLLYYDLDGKPVAGADLENVAFFDQALGGGLALGFSDYSVDIYGPALGLDGAAPPPFGKLTGDFYANINGEPSPVDRAMDEGFMTNDGVTVGVPEPTAWALMLMGFAGLGGALRSSRRLRPA